MAKKAGGYVSVSEVVPNLFVGCKPPEGTLLRDLGFHMLLLCASEHQPDASRFPGVQVLRPRMLDDGTETPADVVRKACPYARAVASALSARKKVLVTCQWGYNRSGIVASLALRMRGMSADQILRLMRSKRPGYDGFQALGTPEYRAALDVGCR
jgi:protein-tyrosine phosphatase